MRSALTRYAAPPELEARIRASLFPERRTLQSQAQESTRVSSPPSRPARQERGPGRSFRLGWNWIGLAASLALVLTLGYGWGGAHARRSQLADEAVSAHLRSILPGHLMDVVSTDRHAVKPWFAGKLAFSPPVMDLAPLGFPLLGGRLDQIGHQRAAALVYGRHAHSINLFIWPAEEAAIGDLHRQESGFQVEGWSASGLNFLAVSDIPADDLAQFSAAIRTPRA